MESTDSCVHQRRIGILKQKQMQFKANAIKAPAIQMLSLFSQICRSEIHGNATNAINNQCSLQAVKAPNILTSPHSVSGSRCFSSVSSFFSLSIFLHYVFQVILKKVLKNPKNECAFKFSKLFFQIAQTQKEIRWSFETDWPWLKK